MRCILEQALIHGADPDRCLVLVAILGQELVRLAGILPHCTGAAESCETTL